MFHTCVCRYDVMILFLCIRNGPVAGSHPVVGRFYEISCRLLSFFQNIIMQVIIMSSIEIQKIGITELNTDAIVNAANEGLWEGGGVCGAIFWDAGSAKMTQACNAIGGCKTGNAVITPGFKLKAKYVIHAVGPQWSGGERNEPKLLYSAYKQSLLLAKENELHSIGFPLISAGIFGYPIDGAWRKAIQACNDFIDANPDYDIKIIFAVLDDQIKAVGEETLREIVGK